MAKDLSSTKERKKLSKKSFALPGKRKYPIPDKAHARNALARVAQHGTKAEQKKVKAAGRGAIVRRSSVDLGGTGRLHRRLVSPSAPKEQVSR